MRTIDTKYVPLFLPIQNLIQLFGRFYAIAVMISKLWFELNLKKGPQQQKNNNNETSAYGNGNTADHIMVAHSMCVMCLCIVQPQIYRF